MKTRICLFIGLLMLSYSIAVCKESVTANNPSQEGSINVYTSTELYPLTMKWVSEFGSVNPALKINVIKSADNNIADLLSKGDGVGFIEDESFASIRNQTGWNMVVGRDIIVPVMNAANPFRDEIYKKGIRPAGLKGVLENPQGRGWGMLLENTQNIPGIPLNYYIMSDPAIVSGVENFLNTNLANIDGIRTAGAAEMVSAIQKDPNALGFCKLIQIMDINSQLVDNLKIVPIDKNGNGKIDYMENIYDNLQAFSRGVWIGKYPKALSGNIYSVSSKKPSNEAELAFLKWILKDGQQYLNANGYSDLVSSEIKSQLDKINEPVMYATTPPNEIYTVLKGIILALILILVLSFIVDATIRRIRIKKEAVLHNTPGFVPHFDENSVIIPKGLYFDKTHTWAFMKKDGTVKIGIDDFLQHITGPVTRIEMKNSGEEVKKGERLLTIIQKGKQLNIYSPISGTIKAQNESLISNSSLLNSAPYEDGWVYTIEPANWLLEIQFLTMAEKYKSWIKDEFSRLRDFFATVVKTDSPEYALIVLQDGGALKDNVLADLGPEIWEDFQTKFIDNNQIVNFFKFLTC